MVAGIRPSRVSVSAMVTSLVPMAMSQTEAMPTPPPKALPWMRPITGLGIRLMACSI